VSGAGKTSILSVLSGQLLSKGEHAEVLGLNLFNKEQLYQLKKYVSICP